MRNTRVGAFLIALALAGSLHALVRAQSGGQNINIITGSNDQFIGDQFRQRQNEPVFGTSSINPSHMMSAYNDYRTVDFANDSGVGTPSPAQGLIAKVLEFFRLPWRRERERGENEEAERAAAAQAWIGLSFSDNNGKDWYTGLLPGHPFGQAADDYASPLRTLGLQAASDPVIATTPNQFFVGGIAFTPNGTSAGFVARFTDRNNTETGQNIQYDWTKLIVTSSATQPQFVDKPSVAAGADGHVYAAFVVFDQSDPQKLSSKIQFYRSSNYGETWSGPVVVSDPLSRNQAPWIVVDPNNENTVYIGWRVFAAQTGGFANAIVGRKSTNGGASFTPIPYPVALFLKAFDQPQGTLPQALPGPRSNAYPTAAIDGNGAIHVALQEYVNPTTGLPLLPGAAVTTGVPRVTVTSSYDGGALWTLRKAIDTGTGTGTQFMPVLTAVGESGGSCAGQSGPRSRIMLMYYDARAGGVGTAPGSTGYVAGGTKQFDVRIAQASACTKDSLGRLVFGASEQLSRYSLSAAGAHNIVTTAGYGYSAVNRAYSMFCGGNCGFSGDYIHLAPRVPYVLTASGWKLTTASGVDKDRLPAPVVQGVWADMRDVLLPTDGGARPVPAGASLIDALPWDLYAPPGLGVPSCINPGSRDQNIYAAEFAPDGLFAAAPATFRTSNIPHAYPLYVENRRAQQRFFKLTIDATSFAAFNHTAFALTSPAALMKTADIAVGPYSTVTGSVVIGPGQINPVTVTVAEIDTAGNPLANGAKSTVMLFTAGTAPPTGTETHVPIVSPVPIVTRPFAGQTTFPFTVSPTTPFTQNPFTQNPFTQNPFTQNPFTQNPFTQNPFTQNPFTQNPFTQNPFTQNPFSQNAAVGTIYDVTDVSFLVANVGNETAAFTTVLNIQNALQLQGSYLFQVLINRVPRTTGLDGCLAVDRSQSLQVSSIITPFTQNPFTQNPFTQNPFTQNPFTQNPFTQNPFTQNPFTQNPFTQNPFTQNPDPRDPVISTSSFYIAPPSTPGQVARAAAPQTPASPVVRSVVQRAAEGQFKTVLVNSPVPTTLKYRSDRPDELMMYSVRAYQIRPTNQIVFPFIPPNAPPPVGIVVSATTPNVVPQPGGGTGFDPAPPVSAAGSAVPVKTAFVAPPTITAPGATIAPAIQAAIQDGFGNTLTTSTLPVTLAIGNNPGGGTLAGTLTQPAVAGIATFSNLSINNAGIGYTLVASSAGVTTATSASFNISGVVSIVVTNTNDSGAGSLRQAMLTANATPVALARQIVFDIPGPVPPYIITPLTALPIMTRPVSIDGSTQHGYAGAPLVLVDGSLTAPGTNGLQLTGGSSVIRGLAIGGFSGVGILLQTGGNNQIAGNYLGTNLAGTAPFDIGGDVILIQDSASNTIGGTVGTTPGGPCTGDCNVIVARSTTVSTSGVDIVGNGVTSGGNQVLGNLIGINAAGSTGLGGPFSFGVFVFNAPNAVIGDGTPAGRNVISGNNTGVGVSAFSTTITGNYMGTNAAGTAAIVNGFGGYNNINFGIQTTGGGHIIERNVLSGNGTGLSIAASTTVTARGNVIGLNAAGTAAIPNTFGVLLSNNAHDNIVGGTTAAERNVISGNTQHGVYIQGASVTGNRIIGNYVGTSPAGGAAIPNGGNGVLIDLLSNSNVIGGLNSGEGNVISGNSLSGVMVTGSSTGNQILGNFVGTDANGAVALGNTLAGVRLSNAPTNTVGGTVAGARNLISGNGTYGVLVDGALSTGNVVRGNYVGTNATGTGVLGQTYGVVISQTTSNTIGGSTAAERNVISANNINVLLQGDGASSNQILGNYIGTNAAGTAFVGTAADFAGVYVQGANNNNVIGGNVIAGLQYAVLIQATGSIVVPTGNVVQGNYIGTNAAGTATLPGGVNHFGVLIEGGTSNTVGGTTAAARNVISGFEVGVAFGFASSTGNVLQGNYIGTDFSGTVALGNLTGVALANAPSNTVGGTVAGARNVISGNTFWGVKLDGALSTGNVVQGNYIGTDVTGTAALGNHNDGVVIGSAAAASDNTIGGSAAGAGNTIAFNTGAGVSIVAGTGNQVVSNSIYSNGGIGIDLGADGVTLNDFLDADSGPNNLQNVPHVSGPSTTQVSGEIFTAPNQSFTIQVFASGSSNHEGKTLVATTIVTTDASGHAFIGPLAVTLASGDWVTMTATDSSGNTSEFSDALQVP